MSRQKFQAALEATPLGKALAQELKGSTITPLPIESYYPRPTMIRPTMLLGSNTDLKAFWMGHRRLPKDLEVPIASVVSGVLVKKQGDFPPFWESQSSFLDSMGEIYDRVKTKNKSVL
jgi:uncharacterized Zn finger protein